MTFSSVNPFKGMIKITPTIRNRIEQALADIRALNPQNSVSPGPEDPRVQDILEFLVLGNGAENVPDMVVELGERKESKLAVALFKILEKKYEDQLDSLAYYATIYALCINGEVGNKGI